MQPEEDLIGSPGEVADMAQALFELRDMLNQVSLFLKDTMASQDLARQGTVSRQTLAMLHSLLEPPP